MKLIVDTNCMISALVRNGFSRHILLYAPFEFYTPEFSIEEIEKYKAEICEKAGISTEEFNFLFSSLLNRLIIKTQSEYSHAMQEAEKLIGDVDKKDVPFLALALAIQNDGIWSDDKHFEKQNKIKVLKTKDLMSFFEDEFS